MSLEYSMQTAGAVRYAPQYTAAQSALATRAPQHALSYAQGSILAASTTYSAGGQYTQSIPSTGNSGSFSDALDSANEALAAEQAASTTAYTPYTSETQQTSSYYDPVTGRQYEYIEGHASGYKGMGYYDERGRAFTDYGAYLREDGFYYPDGAKVSKNGMYVDTGSGWQFAKDCDAFGLAPGTRLDTLPGWNFFGGRGLI